jgi:hypothetical protein
LPWFLPPGPLIGRPRGTSLLVQGIEDFEDVEIDLFDIQIIPIKFK